VPAGAIARSELVVALAKPVEAAVRMAARRTTAMKCRILIIGASIAHFDGTVKPGQGGTELAD
jgi:hypothetical protein